MSAGKQVVFCTDGIFPHAVGGMQRHSALLVEELAKTKQFSLVVIHPHEGKVFNPSLGIHEIPLNHKRTEKSYLLYCYRYSKKIYDELQKFPGAIIYSQGLSVWKGVSEFKDRLIINPHGLEPYQAIETIKILKAWRFRLIFNHLFRNATTIISLGGRLTDILKKITGDSTKIAVIPNAVNLSEKKPHNFDKNVLQLLFVGRFAYNKGIHILMQAIEELNNEGYKNRLVFNIVGKGPLFNHYTTKFNFPNVNYLGFASDDDLQRLYSENDLFVFPTLYEGMPTVVLEAMAAGMPAIVSDTGATAELVDNKNGFLIEKNNVRALKWAIQSFYQMTAAQRSELSAISYHRVGEKFTWPIVAQKHTELFNTFMS